MTDIKINVYRDSDEWYGALWIDGVYDDCLPLGIEPDADDDDAISAAETMRLTISGSRSVTKVADI